MYVLSSTFTRLGDRFTPVRLSQRKADLLEALKFLESIEQRKAVLRSFCLELVRKLPRELRDMVYGYLMPSPSVTIYGDDQCQYQDGKPVAGAVCFYANSPHPDIANGYPYDPSKLYLPAYTLPYCPDAEALGTEMSNELSVYFHRHTQFHFADNDSRVFEKCLKEGLFTQPIKKLAVSVYIDPDYAQYQLNEEMRLRVEQEYTACLHDLIKYPADDIDLTISIWTLSASQDRIKDFRKMLNIVFPRMTRLRDAGYSITLVLDPGTASHLRGDFRSEVVLTPKDVDFSINGYMDGLRKVS